MEVKNHLVLPETSNSRNITPKSINSYDAKENLAAKNEKYEKEISFNVTKRNQEVNAIEISDNKSQSIPCILPLLDKHLDTKEINVNGMNNNKFSLMRCGMPY